MILGPRHLAALITVSLAVTASPASASVQSRADMTVKVGSWDTAAAKLGPKPVAKL